MTHDELLAKMKELSRTFAYEPNLNFESALRAVVELHKPMKDPFYGDMVCHCGVVGDTRYPCPTIQTIQEQLK